MTYNQTLEFLYQSLPMYQRSGKAAYKANLNNTILLDKALGQAHKTFRSIHVAGTNGKGSVSHMLASILQEAGFKTGLYTSPHLLDFRERIRINGKPVSESFVIDFVESIKAEIVSIQPSFFEMTVAMAFSYFSKEKVDIAIIETGLGGRLDSTNIISPEISVITSISMDHSEFLGNSIPEIAAEKSGIIKEGIPVIAGVNPPEVRTVIKDHAQKMKARYTEADRSRQIMYLTSSLAGHMIIHFNKNEKYEIDLLGHYQAENLQTVLAVTDEMKRQAWKIEENHIQKGLKSISKNTGLRGRWEILGSNPRILCDTAHNIGGISLVMKQLKTIPLKKLHIIWGMTNEKKPEDFFLHLPKDAIYYVTQASIPRAMPADDLLKRFSSAGLKTSMHNNVEMAIKAAISVAEEADTIFIGGSTFVVADALLYFQS